MVERETVEMTPEDAYNAIISFESLLRVIHVVVDGHGNDNHGHIDLQYVRNTPDELYDIRHCLDLAFNNIYTHPESSRDCCNRVYCCSG